MRRLNPWIMIPAALVGLLVGWLGWVATNVSCRADQAPGGPGCPLAATIVGAICLIGATIGLAVVLALTGRSIGEYRAERDRENVE